MLIMVFMMRMMLIVSMMMISRWTLLCACVELYA